MIPTLFLGREPDVPSFEIQRRELYPILAVLVASTTSSEESKFGLMHILWLDTLHLHSDSAPFFLALEDTCKQIVAGNIVEYDHSVAATDELYGFLLLPDDGGVLGPKVVDEAQRFIDFLNANGDRWPPTVPP